MGGRPVAGSFAGEDTLALSNGNLGEEGADMLAPSVNDGGVVTGWQAGSCAEMGRGQRELGRPRRKRPTTIF
jgi:hypothetical protein